MAETPSTVVANPETPAGKGASPEAEANIQAALDDTFGGVDKSDQEADGGDDKVATTTVREHKRRRVPRKPKESNKPKPQPRSGWDEEEGTEAGADDDAGDDDEAGEVREAPKSRERRQAAEDDDDLTDPDDDGDGPTAGEGTEIPESLLNAARRRGWSDDRIKRLVKADPELALDTFEQLQEDANSISQQFAELGRHVQGMGGGLPQQTVPGQPGGAVGYGQGQVMPNPQAGLPQPGQQQGTQQQHQGLVPKFQFPEGTAEGLDETFVSNVMTPVQQFMNQVGSVLNTVVGSHDRFIQERREEALFNQIDDFFGGLGDDYGDLYGSGGRSEIDETAMLQRSRVVREADAIRHGAMAQGRNLSVQEALEMAHNLVSSPHRDKAARRKLTGKVQKRSNQITVPPTSRKTDETTKDPLERATAKAAKRLAKLNGNRR